MMVEESLSMIINDVPGLISDLTQRVTYPVLAQEINSTPDRLVALEKEEAKVSDKEVWELIRSSNKFGFFDLLPAHGVPSVSYNLSSPFDLTAPPIGFSEDPPIVPLLMRPSKIGGLPVDFPIGLPASVLAANSQWIDFYARRGFDILTYKTVRTRYRKEHQWPNWVFLSNPVEVANSINKGEQKLAAIGAPGFWPHDLSSISMANSFGVPSLAPDWWQDDIRRARAVVREGHQVLIVSVIASVDSSEDAIAADFADAAFRAKSAGADIIEANFSCPNVCGDQAVGEVYQRPESAARIAKAIKEAIAPVPLFVKIGYLPPAQLQDFLMATSPYIDGVVAINTISAPVRKGFEAEASPTFPDRPTAGISGWAIKTKAQEVARTLVQFRDHVHRESGGQRQFTVLGVGGVLDRGDIYEFLDDIRVDGVESCTGAFLNPHLALHARLDKDALRKTPTHWGFNLELAGTVLRELLTTTKMSRIRADRNTGTIVVERR